MKTKKITLVSHYFGTRLNLRVKPEVYEEMKTSDAPIWVIYFDMDAVAYGRKPRYITEYQARKVRNYFGESIEYFDKVEL